MQTITQPRPSPIAGLWYSDQPKQLSRQIDAFLADAVLPALQGEVVAIIAPHAGYRYSGRTAGHAFRAAQGLQRDLVVVVSPFHNFHSSSLLTTAHSAYQTPLGEIPVDAEALAELDENLRRHLGSGLTALPHDPEHALEIELPFLQRALNGPFQLLPLMLRSQSPRTAQAIGAALAETAAHRSVLLVASTDLSHFYPEEVANQLDAEMLRQMEAFSPEGMLKAEQNGTGFACGVAAAAAVLWAARELGASRVQILHHSTSGDETGDHSSVVGYGAAVALKNT